jgi:hypothetical protein
VAKSKKSNSVSASGLKQENLAGQTRLLMAWMTGAQKLKTFCACGGTSKNGQIMLQGDHRERVREFLIKMGYPEENIELQ